MIKNELIPWYNKRIHDSNILSNREFSWCLWVISLCLSSLDIHELIHKTWGQDKSSQRQECYERENGVGMQRSCQIFSKLSMHTTLILKLEEYMFKEVNELKRNHIYTCMSP